VFTFNTTPTTDLDKLRVIIGDTTFDNGPAPDHSNLADAILDYFLETAESIAGAAALAFEHLAALWVSRPIFGPGDLATVHTNLYDKYMKLAAEWRSRDTAAGELSGITPATVGFDLVRFSTSDQEAA
jgi:hypothetical protein